jgi:hypothetical protein
MSIEILMECIPAKYCCITDDCASSAKDSSAFKDLPRYSLDYLVNGSFGDADDKNKLCLIYAPKLDAKHLLIVLNKYKQKMLEKQQKEDKCNNRGDRNDAEIFAMFTSYFIKIAKENGWYHEAKNYIINTFSQEWLDDALKSYSYEDATVDKNDKFLSCQSFSNPFD